MIRATSYYDKEKIEKMLLDGKEIVLRDLENFKNKGD